MEQPAAPVNARADAGVRAYGDRRTTNPFGDARANGRGLYSHRAGQRDSHWQVILCHALPNALIPSVTVLGPALGDLLYGAVLTETVFAWPGMGAYVVSSIQALDFPAVMGFAVVVSFAYVLVNLLVDLLYVWIDPRIGRVG